jgi:hypothetical protein
VAERPPDADDLALREADIEIIDDLTATIGEPAQGEIIPNE